MNTTPRFQAHIRLDERIGKKRSKLSTLELAQRDIDKIVKSLVKDGMSVFCDFCPKINSIRIQAY